MDKKYRRWSDEEDKALMTMVTAGLDEDAIAKKLIGRTPLGIRKRLSRLTSIKSSPIASGNITKEKTFEIARLRHKGYTVNQIIKVVGYSDRTIKRYTDFADYCWKIEREGSKGETNDNL